MDCVYVSNEHGYITSETFRSVAAIAEYIGAGVSRDVYDLGDVVLKVSNGNKYAGDCSTEVSAWNQIAIDDRKHFATVYAADPDGKWLIMEKVAGTWDRLRYDSETDRDSYDEAIACAESYGIGDLHGGNIGVRYNGTVCIIDYAFTDEREGDYNECQCFEHDCRRCMPDGCDCCCSRHDRFGCESFYGCNQMFCSLCIRNDADRIQQNSRFGFRTGTKHNVCGECAPSAVPTVVQCIGQGRLVQGRDSQGSVLILDAVTQTWIERNRLGIEREKEFVGTNHIDGGSLSPLVVGRQ